MRGEGCRVQGLSLGFGVYPVDNTYLRLIDSCITQLKAQGPSRTCNESKEEEEEEVQGLGSGCGVHPVDSHARRGVEPGR